MANNPGGEIKAVRRYLPSSGEIHMGATSGLAGIPHIAGGCGANVFSAPYSVSSFTRSSENTDTSDLNLRNLVYGANIFSNFNSNGTANSNNANIPTISGSQVGWGDYYNGDSGGQMFGTFRSATTIHGFTRSATAKWKMAGTRTSPYHWGFSKIMDITNQLGNSRCLNQAEDYKPAPITDGRTPLPTGEDDNSQPGHFSDVLYVYHNGTNFYIAVAGEWDYNTEMDAYPLPQAFILQIGSPSGVLTTRFNTNASNCTLSFPARPSNQGESTQFAWTNITNPFKPDGTTELLPSNTGGVPDDMNFTIYPVR